MVEENGDTRMNFQICPVCGSRDTFVFLERNKMWGAGAKGVMYANMIDSDSEFISDIVDVNPDKQEGLFQGVDIW
ncbi:MAG: hypothetical protein BWY45_03267 [Euryarchaeota archaeon ADurb.Bin294]|jgi:hypothetical protein|nr:MAG: hypothetical protein BWY45_03267 [Euryarchaeota archaeon ADurb.Bin294]